MPHLHEGMLDARERRFAIVSSRFNDLITERLIDGAVDALVRHGAARDALDIYKVPGAFELPMMARRVAQRGAHDAIICLGALIRGATPHFDKIASAATGAILQVALDHDLPVAFGLLTCDTIEQALERAGTKAGNKGAEAALAAIEMADLYRRVPAAQG